MRDDDRMFSWGLTLFILAWLLVGALQVMYRVQDRARQHVKSEIVATQQDYAAARMQFSTLTRNEILNGVILEMYPKFAPIGFTKTINVGEIPMKEEGTEKTEN